MKEPSPSSSSSDSEANVTSETGNNATTKAKQIAERLEDEHQQAVDEEMDDATEVRKSIPLIFPGDLSIYFDDFHSNPDRSVYTTAIKSPRTQH